MFRKLIVGAIVVNFLFMLAGVIAPTAAKFRDSALAGNTTAEYLASCTVEEQLEINANLYKMLPDGSDIDWDSPATELDFGTLEPVVDENDTILYMAGADSYAAVMYPATSGREYNLVVSGEVLVGSEGGTIGEGSTEDAYLVVPDYQWQDEMGGETQGEPPTDAYVGEVAQIGTASNHVIYTSGAEGKTKAVRAYFGIGGPDADGKKSSWSKGHNGAEGQGTEQDYDEGVDWDLVPPDQKAGDYTGSVTLTLTLI